MQDNQSNTEKSKKKHQVEAVVDYLVSGDEDKERLKLIARLRKLKAQITSSTSPEQIHGLLLQYTGLSTGINLPIDLDVETVRALAESKITFFNALVEENITPPQKSKVLNILYATFEIITTNEKKCADLDEEHKEILEFADNFIRQYREDPKQFTKKQLAEAMPILELAVAVRNEKAEIYLDSHQQITQALEVTKNSNEEEKIKDYCVLRLDTELQRVKSDHQSNNDQIFIARAILLEISGADREKFTSQIVDKQHELTQRDHELMQRDHELMQRDHELMQRDREVQLKQQDVHHNQRDAKLLQLAEERRQRRIAEKIAKNAETTRIPAGPQSTPTNNVNKHHDKSK